MDVKYNVLMVHNYYKISGGEDTVFANEKKMLEDRGHKVITYTRNNKEIDGFGFLKKLFLPFASIFNFKTYRDIKRIIKKEKIDIVHVHNTLSLVSPSVYYATKKKKVPVVQTIHNFRLLCPAATFYRNGKICEDCVSKGFKCAVKNKCYRNSKLQTLTVVWIQRIHRLFKIYKKINYICLTDFNKEKLLQHGQIKEKQVFVKPNFCKVNNTVIPYNEREDYYVFVGRLEEIKGVKFLIECFHDNRLRNERLLLLGSGPLLQECKDYLITKNIGNITVLGQVSHENAVQIISKAKALILPTQVYEGFPMTIVEAFSVGTPVIGPDMGNVGNLIKYGVNGWKYKANDESDFINTILSFEKNVIETTKLCVDEFSEEKNYIMLSNIYEEIVN